MALTKEERESKEQEIRDLTQDLTSPVSPIGDWKVVKIQEYNLMQRSVPYDVDDLHAKRQAARDRINQLQAELTEG